MGNFIVLFDLNTIFPRLLTNLNYTYISYFYKFKLILLKNSKKF